MEVATLEARLVAEIGGFIRDMKAADALITSATAHITAMEREFKKAGLNITAATGPIKAALEGISDKARQAEASIHGVGFSPGQVARIVAEAAVVKRALGDVNAGPRGEPYLGPNVGAGGRGGGGRPPIGTGGFWDNLGDVGDGRGGGLPSGGGRGDGGRGGAIVSSLAGTFRPVGAGELTPLEAHKQALRDKESSALQNEQRRITREISALRRGGGVDGHGRGRGGRGFLSGILPGGGRPGPVAFAALAGLGIAAGPQLLAAGGGLAQGGSTLLGMAAGSFATFKLSGFADVLKGMSDFKTYQGLDQTQKSLANLLRTAEGGVGAQLHRVAQAGLLPGIQAGIVSALTPNTIHALTQATQSFSMALGGAARSWGRFFGSTEFSSQFGMYMRRNAGYIDHFSDNVRRLFDIFLRWSNSGGTVVDWLDRISTHAIKNAQAWAQSAKGTQQMHEFSQQAIASLRQLGDLVWAFGRSLKALFEITQGLNVIGLLTQALNVLAQFLNQNRDVLRHFFEGARQSVEDVFRVIHLLGQALGPLLRELDQVAKNIGGWRIVIDVLAAFWIGRFVAMRAAAVATWFATALGISATEAAAAPLIAELQAINASLVAMGASATEGALVAEGALVKVGASADAAASGGVARLISSLRFLGISAAVTFGAIQAYNLAMPAKDALPGTTVAGQTPSGKTIFNYQGSTYVASPGHENDPGAVVINTGGRGLPIVLVPYDGPGVPDASASQAAAHAGRGPGTATLSSAFQGVFSQRQQMAVLRAQQALATAHTAAQQAAANAQLAAAYKSELASVNALHPGTEAQRLQQEQQRTALLQAIQSYGPPLPFETGVPKPKHPRHVFNPLSQAMQQTIAQAQAEVQSARTSGDTQGQLAALNQLEQVYKHVLSQVRAEHETGANRTKQLKEEAVLLKDIANTHDKILRLQKEITKATLVTNLGQGPYLTSQNAQTALSFGYKPTGRDYLIDERAQVAQNARWIRDLRELSRRTHDPALVASLQGQGIGGAGMVHSILTLNAAQLKQYDQFFKKLQSQVRITTMTVAAGTVIVNAKGIAQHNTSGAHERGRGAHMAAAKAKFLARHRGS